ncbi:SCO family protein [Methylomicrobium lacus]|uniref:SCO family protein n=1 Tax=Methylomicrobium lacus TaxID=136992 RepID=UPI0035A85D52
MIIELTHKAIIVILASGILTVLLPSVPPVATSVAMPAVQLPDAELLDQHGTSVRLARDVVGDRIIALSFIYTDCHTACPVSLAMFSELQSRLGEKQARDVRIVSLSINPAVDSPARLKAYAEHFHAKPGWIWLTGKKAQIDALLKELGIYTNDHASHASVILVGDPIFGEWRRFNNFSNPEAIAAKIDELLDARDELLVARDASPRERISASH